MPGCSVQSCKNHTGPKAVFKFKYFKFPTDPLLAKEWVKACNNNNIHNLKDPRVCSKHFLPEYFLDTKHLNVPGQPPTLKLCKNAVPTENLFNDKSQECSILKREADDNCLSNDELERKKLCFEHDLSTQGKLGSVLENNVRTMENLADEVDIKPDIDTVVEELLPTADDHANNTVSSENIMVHIKEEIDTTCAYNEIKKEMEEFSAEVKVEQEELIEVKEELNQVNQDGDSIDSDQAAALGHVEACLQENVQVKTEDEISPENAQKNQQYKQEYLSLFEESFDSESDISDFGDAENDSDLYVTDDDDSSSEFNYDLYSSEEDSVDDPLGSVSSFDSFDSIFGSDAQNIKKLKQVISEPVIFIPVQNDDNNLKCFKGKNGHLWSVTKPNFVKEFKLDYPKCIHEVSNVLDPFLAVFDDSMIDKIVNYTNEKLDRYKQKHNDVEDLYPTNTQEFKSLLGLLVFTSLSNAYQWSMDMMFDDIRFAPPIFRAVMQKNRFKVLLNCLRFDDYKTRTDRLKKDKLAGVSEIFNMFVKNCKDNYSLGSHVALTRTILPLKNQDRLDGYTTGLQIFVLNDGETSYFYDFYIYFDSAHKNLCNIRQGEKGKLVAQEVAAKLTETVQNQNKNVIADTWFTSIELVQQLKEKGLTFFGPIQNKDPHIPKEFKKCQGRSINSSYHAFSDDITLTSYVLKKNQMCNLVSSYHHEAEVESKSKIPRIMFDYMKINKELNSTLLNCSNYTCCRRSTRWTLKIFYRIVDFSCSNAFILYRHKHNIKNYYGYLRQLGRSLIMPQVQDRLKDVNVSEDIKTVIRNILSQKDGPVSYGSDASSSGTSENECNQSTFSNDMERCLNCYQKEFDCSHDSDNDNSAQ